MPLYTMARFTYRELPGAISRRSLQEHIKLYQRYIETLKSIDKSDDGSIIPEHAGGYQPFRGLKEAERHAVGGALLHGLFFSGLTDEPTEPRDLAVMDAIVGQWGSTDAWWNEMRGTALVAKGWAALAGGEDGLRIFMLDTHEMGGMFGFKPLVVLDTYEHSWWSDHPNDKAGYVDALAPYVNWTEIEARFSGRAYEENQRVVLPEDPWRYFTKPTGTKLIDVADLETIRAREKGIAHAEELMLGAYNGHNDRRGPIHVKPSGGGTYQVVDGNSTVAVARKHGWEQIPAIVVA